MITLTVKQLIDATSTGALQRFFAIRKTISAGHKNRKLPSGIQTEIKLYNDKRMDLIAKHGGVLATPDAKEYTFKDMAAFSSDHKELLSQPIQDLPGERLKLADLLDGGLLEQDYEFLEPFLGE